MAITASEARKRLFPLIEQVNDDQEPVEILSKSGTAFLVPEAQWRSLLETAHLLRNPANARRLLDSMARIERGEYEEHTLLIPAELEADQESDVRKALGWSSTRTAGTTTCPGQMNRRYSNASID